MSRGMVFVAAYSVVLLGLFGTFCYLMSIVNPTPRRKFPDDNRTEEVPTKAHNPPPPPQERAKKEEKPSEGLIGSSSLVDYIDAEAGRKTQKYLSEILSKLKLKAARRHDAGHPKKNETVKVRPPPWPLLMDEGEFDTTTEIPRNDTMPPVSETNHTVKGFRRSIKDDFKYEELKNIADSDSVILKIMDDKGNSRIEIKLGSNGPLRTRNNKNPGSKTKTKFSMFVKPNHTADLMRNRLPKNAVIKVMPDNTLIIDDGSNLNDDTTSSINNTETITNNITQKLNNDLQMNDSANNMVTLKDSNNTTEFSMEIHADMKLKVPIDNKEKFSASIENEPMVNEDKTTPLVDGNYIKITGAYKTEPNMNSTKLLNMTIISETSTEIAYNISNKILIQY